MEGAVLFVLVFLDYVVQPSEMLCDDDVAAISMCIQAICHQNTHKNTRGQTNPNTNAHEKLISHNFISEFHW